MTHKEYPALRKLFLQWMFAERIVLLPEAQEFFQDLTSKLDFGLDEDNEKDTNVFIDYCKKALNPISISLKKQLFVHTDRKDEYIGICNMKSDSISQTATKFSAANIEQFKKIIDISRKSPNHVFRPFDIEQTLKLTKNQIQLLLSELIEGGWIFSDKSKGLLYLGPRTLLELGDYMKELAGEEDDDTSCSFQDCSLCSSIINCGSKISCDNQECRSQFHHFCISEYSRTTEKSECPKCQKSIKNIL